MQPAGRRGRPLILTASFKNGSNNVRVVDANPAGDQPFQEECQTCELHNKQIDEQSKITTHYVRSLKDTGFKEAEKLSRLLEKEFGFHVAPSVILLFLLFALLAATTTAAYLLIRYAKARDVFRIHPNPQHQGQLPPGYSPKGLLIEVLADDTIRVEHRLLPDGRHSFICYDPTIPFTRRYPDTNYRFDWKFHTDAGTITTSTDTPEAVIAPPTPTLLRQVEVHPVETVHYRIVMGNYGNSPPPGVPVNLAPGQAEHLVVDSTSRGWIDGIVAVPPLPQYAPTRHSPLGASVVTNRKIRFAIRLGPVREQDQALKVTFGDDTAWSSLDEPWHPLSNTPGDDWDRYQTNLEHSYTHDGTFPLRAKLFRKTRSGWITLRQASGTVFVNVPIPASPPEAPSPGFNKIIVDKSADDKLHGITVTTPVDETPSCLAYYPTDLSGAKALLLAQPCGHDPLTVGISVVFARTQDGAGCASCPIAIDFGDGTSARASRESPQYIVAGSMHEYLRSGVYPITATTYRGTSTVPLAQVTGQIILSPVKSVQASK